MFVVRSSVTILSLWKAHVVSNWRRTLLSLITVILILALLSQMLLLAYSYRLNSLNVPPNNWEPDFKYSSRPVWNTGNKGNGFNFSALELEKKATATLQETLRDAQVPLETRNGLIVGSYYYAKFAVQFSLTEQILMQVMAISDSLLQRFFGLQLQDDQALLLNVELTDYTSRSTLIDAARSFFENTMETFEVGGTIDLRTPIYKVNFGSYSVINVINKEMSLSQLKESRMDATDLFDFLFLLRPAIYSDPSYYEAPMFIHIMLVNMEGFHGLLDDFLAQVIDSSPYTLWSWNFVANMRINLAKFQETMTLDDLRTRYEFVRRSFINKMRPMLDEYGWLGDLADGSEEYYDYNIGLDWRIDNSENIYYTVIFYVIAMGLPVVVMTILLGNFTMNLSKRAIRHQIGSLKARGAGSEQIFTILWLEVLVFLGIASIIIPILGEPLAGFLLRSTGILDFSGSSLVVVSPSNYIPVVILTALMLGIIFKFRSIFHNARMTVSESIQPIVELEPFWKRHNVDFFILFLGLLELFLMNLFFDIFEITGVIKSLLPILLLAGFTAPLLFILGLTMISSRFIPRFIALLEKIPGFLDLILISFFMKDIRRRHHLLSRATIVLTLGISMMMVIFAFPMNTTSQAWQNARYTVGSDFLVTHPVNDTFQSQLETNLTNYGSVAITPIMTVEFRDYADRIVNQFKKIKILGIDPDTVMDAMYFENRFGFPRLGAEKALQELKKHPNSSLLMFSSSLKGLFLENGGNISFSSKRLSFFDKPWTIVDTYDYWPGFVEQDDILDYEIELHVIMSIDALMNFVHEAAREISFRRNSYLVYRPGYLIKLNSNDYQRHQDVRRELTVGLSLNVKAAIDQPGTYILDASSIVARSLFGSVNLVSAMSFIVLTAMLLTYGITYQKERWKELGVERVLGMNRLELFLFSMINIFLLLLITSLLGVAFGFIGTNVLMNIAQLFNTESVFPPAVVLYPIDETMNFLAALVVMAVLGAIISAIYATRREISNILKVE